MYIPFITNFSGIERKIHNTGTELPEQSRCRASAVDVQRWPRQHPGLFRWAYRLLFRFHTEVWLSSTSLDNVSNHCMIAWNGNDPNLRFDFKKHYKWLRETSFCILLRLKLSHKINKLDRITSGWSCWLSVVPGFLFTRSLLRFLAAAVTA